jgi:hypothetical protein
MLSYGLDTRRRSQSDVQADAIKYASARPIYSLGDFRQLDPEYQRVFERFVDDLAARKIKVIFFLAPYHPLVYDTLLSDPRYVQVACAEAWYREQAARRGIPVVGSFSPAACGLTAADFYDAMHPRREAVSSLFAQELRR